jgi:glycosyltransferase involved in cell wall biosynthesis
VSVVSKTPRRGFTSASKARAVAESVIKRGAVAFKLRSLAFSRMSHPLRRYARGRLGLPGKAEGINFVAYIRAEMGLGEASRGMATAIESARIPFNIINYEYENPSRHGDTTWSHKEVTRSDYDVSLLGINFDNVLTARQLLPARIFRDRYIIGYWYWELPEFPEESLAAFAAVDEVWVGSHFVQDAIAPKSPVPVVRIPPVVSVATAGGGHTRAYFRLPERRFLFLSMGDTRSVLERKNPLAVVRSFKQAFDKSDTRVGLVLKLNNPDYREPEFDALIDETRGCENIYLLSNVMTRAEINSLISVTDCMVSLHRSEGFGLGPAEAMGAGKPVIVTNWSGNTDYMTKDNSIGIDYELVKLGKDYGSYKSSQHWADPDVEQAAYWMKRLVAEPALAEDIGGRGREMILSEYSPERVGQMIRRRLEYIRRGV